MFPTAKKTDLGQFALAEQVARNTLHRGLLPDATAKEKEFHAALEQDLRCKE